MKNNTSNKPLWLRRMNKIALIVALALIIYGLVSAYNFLGGFSDIFAMNILFAAIMPIIGIIFLMFSPYALLGVMYLIADFVLNIDYSHNAKYNNCNNNNYAYGCNYNNNSKFCGFGNDRYYM